jgi:hypothetical protein
VTNDPLTLLVQQKLADTDPQVAQLAQMLTQHEEQLSRELEAREDEARKRREEAREEGATRRHVEELSAELDALRGVLDEIADALGACPDCWGAEPQCRMCRGRGGPGFMPPDRDRFDRYVLPAVRTHAALGRRAVSALPVSTPDTAKE